MAKLIIPFLLIGMLVAINVPFLQAKVDPPATREQFLDEIQKRALAYFVRERNPHNGLIRDWAWNERGGSESVATVAGTGFALTAYGIGVSRGWLEHGKALDLVKKSLLFLRDQAPQERGFFYHFMAFETGNRVNGSELSPIDTALAMLGVLFVSEYFTDPEIKQLADDIYERVDWPWMLNGGDTFAHAWTPEKGFFPRRWSHFDESLLLYLLAIGAPTKPVSKDTWYAVQRKIGSYKSHRLIQSPPLFTHQYPHLWYDFRNKNDGIVDYFENSKQAVLAQRLFAIEKSSVHRGYGPNSWGFTAAEGPFGYKAYGAPPGWANHDGTVAPTGCGASVPFAPDASLACLEHFRDVFGDDLWGKYGFSDAFNVDQGWFSNKAFAINQGPILIAIENYRSGLVWDVMNQTPSVKQAFEKVGFKEGTIPTPWPKALETTASYTEKPIVVDGSFGDWGYSRSMIHLDESKLESGVITDKTDLGAVVRFAWNEEFLYFSAEVQDSDLILRKERDQIFRDDLLELYIDPRGDGLKWGNPRDFQLGFRVDPEKLAAKSWAWFQGGNDPTRSGVVQAAGRTTDWGYRLEGAVKWEHLNIDITSVDEVRVSVAIHDVDRDRTETKLNWFFRGEYDLDTYELGRVRLVHLKS